LDGLDLLLGGDGESFGESGQAIFGRVREGTAGMRRSRQGMCRARLFG
jgi:hypothetical protein